MTVPFHSKTSLVFNFGRGGRVSRPDDICNISFAVCFALCRTHNHHSGNNGLAFDKAVLFDAATGGLPAAKSGGCGKHDSADRNSDGFANLCLRIFGLDLDLDIERCPSWRKYPNKTPTLKTSELFFLLIS